MKNSDRGSATHTVRGEEAGGRIDVFVAEVGLVPSRALVQKLIERNCVRVNGQTVTKRYKVRGGDRISVELPPMEPSELIAEDVPLDIRFEDEYMIVLSKAAGMVVHPSHGHWSGTLVHALLAHSDDLSTLAGEERPGIVHRLDKDTSGLMMVAKNDDVQRALQSMIQQRLVNRRYAALVHGRIVPDTGLVDAPIGRHAKDPRKMWVSDAGGSRQAVTSFRTLERFEAGGLDDGYTMIECKLQTGRTHQIRVHMAYIQHAVVGDPLYGRIKLKEDLGLTRQFLHSYSLEFEHPVTGELIALVEPLPEDLAGALRSIEDRSDGRTVHGDEVLPLVLPA
ncbi:MAG: RluA family pseudouridine synthase [Coriobacteriia bacterium]|nr:RluA family pseudouridine synthase [Coriobacteriia bacterium]